MCRGPGAAQMRREHDLPRATSASHRTAAEDRLTLGGVLQSKRRRQAQREECEELERGWIGKCEGFVLKAGLEHWPVVKAEGGRCSLGRGVPRAASPPGGSIRPLVNAADPRLAECATLLIVCLCKWVVGALLK